MKKSMKERRLSLGMTQTELAKILCVEQSTVHRWENGRVSGFSARYVEKELTALEAVTKEAINS